MYVIMQEILSFDVNLKPRIVFHHVSFQKKEINYKFLKKKWNTFYERRLSEQIMFCKIGYSCNAKLVHFGVTV